MGLFQKKFGRRWFRYVAKTVGIDS